MNWTTDPDVGDDAALICVEKSRVEEIIKIVCSWLGAAEFSMCVRMCVLV